MASQNSGDTKTNELLSHIEDYQLTHGSVIKLSTRNLSDWDDSDDDGLNTALTIARPVGISIVPTPLPKQLFDQALQLQPLFNELYIRVAEDEAWLKAVLDDMIQHDDFTGALWTIWERAKAAGEMQPVRCGVWRSDYMLHQNPAARDPTALEACELKQVEFNTYSCAGSCHANIVADMHRYLARRRFHDGSGVRLENLPMNNNTNNVVKLLESAHRAYRSPSGVAAARPKAILMTVQPNNINVCDERPIEYGLGNCDAPVPLFRVEFSADVLKCCWVGEHRELLFRPPSTSQDEIYEISVVYQRAGYDADEYDENGVEARVLLESSWAIKCPSLLSHIAGFKKVQQELARPGILERFVDAAKACLLRETFMDMYPLDESGASVLARGIVFDEERVNGFILKPSLEGGGHNVYGGDIPRFLATIPEHRWSSYILMEKIKSPLVQGQLKSGDAVYRGPVISELGVVGACLWRRQGREGSIEITRNENNEQSGWTLKTKASHVKEMSVVKGYGSFDCPQLVDA